MKGIRGGKIEDGDARPKLNRLKTTVRRGCKVERVAEGIKITGPTVAGAQFTILVPTRDAAAICEMDLKAADGYFNPVLVLSVPSRTGGEPEAALKLDGSAAELLRRDLERVLET